MRRTDRQLPDHAVFEILDAAAHGTLAMCSPDGPYAVVLNHVRVGNSLYFHCAHEGHKLDCLAHDPRVCFSAVASARVHAPTSTTLYRSVTAFGTLRRADEPEARDALRAFCQKFGVPFPADEFAMPCVLAMEIVQATAKGNEPK